MRESQELAIPPELISRLGIEKWAGSYPIWERDMDNWIEDIVQTARDGKKYLTTEEMRALAMWKSEKRTFEDLKHNEDGQIEARTEEAFRYRGKDAVVHIKLLVGVSGKRETRINGVNIATASSFLHFAFPESYPVIDRFSLLAMGVRKNKRGFGLWRRYTNLCVSHAKRHRVTLRTLDRALWQLGKESDQMEKAHAKRKRLRL